MLRTNEYNGLRYSALRILQRKTTRIVPKSLTLRTLCIAIFLFGLAIRLALMWLWGLHHRPEDPPEWERIAKNLAETGRFADPFRTPTGLTAHWAPAYPFLLSLAFRAGGYDSDGWLLAMLLNATLASLVYACLPLLAHSAGLPLTVGVVAGVIGASIPMRVLTELMLSAGGPQLRSLVWVGLQILTAALFRVSHPSLPRAFAYGLAMGATFHADPGLLPVSLLWLGLLIYLNRLTLRCLTVIALGVLIAILPWTLRNRVRLGGWIFIRSNFGLELALSNHDRAHPVLPYEIFPMDSPEVRHWMALHPAGSLEHRLLLRNIGELAYNRLRLSEAWNWIQRNPKKFILLSLERARSFWFYPDTGRPWRRLIFHPMVATAAFGLILMIRLHRFPGLLFLANWVAYPMVYYFIQVSTRYRYPIEWTILFLNCYAGWALWHCWHGFRGRVRASGARKELS